MTSGFVTKIVLAVSTPALIPRDDGMAGFRLFAQDKIMAEGKDLIEKSMHGFACQLMSAPTGGVQPVGNAELCQFCRKGMGPVQNQISGFPRLTIVMRCRGIGDQVVTGSVEKEGGNCGIGENFRCVGNGACHGDDAGIRYRTGVKAVAHGRLVGGIQHRFGTGAAPCQNDLLRINPQGFAVFCQEIGGVLNVFHGRLKGVQLIGGPTVTTESCGFIFPGKAVGYRDRIVAVGCQSLTEFHNGGIVARTGAESPAVQVQNHRPVLLRITPGGVQVKIEVLPAFGGIGERLNGDGVKKRLPVTLLAGDPPGQYEQKEKVAEKNPRDRGAPSQGQNRNTGEFC